MGSCLQCRWAWLSDVFLHFLYRHRHGKVMKHNGCSQEILMSLKIESALCVCARISVYVHVWLWCIVWNGFSYSDRCPMVSKTMGGWWDVSYYREKMGAGEWIHGGKVEIILAVLMARLYLARWLTSVIKKTLVSQCCITSSVQTHKHTGERLPVSFVLFHSICNTWDVAVWGWVTYCELDWSPMDLQFPAVSQRHE